MFRIISYGTGSKVVVNSLRCFILSQFLAIPSFVTTLFQGYEALSKPEPIDFQYKKRAAVGSTDYVQYLHYGSGHYLWRGEALDDDDGDGDGDDDDDDDEEEDEDDEEDEEEEEEDEEEDDEEEEEEEEDEEMRQMVKW
jgi:hypothetical protein